jgi:transposase
MKEHGPSISSLLQFSRVMVHFCVFPPPYARVLLPAYSPDLSPIEHAFSRLKAALRKDATRGQRHAQRHAGRTTQKDPPKRVPLP